MELDFKECSKLEVIPTNINLESPTKELDPHIRRISRLRGLVIRGMKKLVSLPQLPYSLLELHARDCESLERLDCIFPNQDIELDFSECFKLNQEARDLIIHRPTNRYAVLPGREVPACFTYRATGSFLKVKLNQNPLCTSTKFKACLLLENGIRRGRGKDNTVYCYITSKQNALTTCISKRTLGFDYFTEHLYIFEVEVEEVTSTELDFEFSLGTWFATTNWMIKECAVFQLEDGDENYETSDTESSEE